SQVGIDLREHVTGQESEPLARLDCRPREDDAPDLAVRQRRDRERHRQVRLAGARRPDREGHRVPAHRVDIALLVKGLRRDSLAAMAPDDVLEDIAQVLGLVEGRKDCVNRARLDLVAALDELAELVDHRAGLRDVGVRALDREAVSAEQDRAAEPVPKRFEHAVAHGCELGRDVVRDGENLLHWSLSVGAAAGTEAVPQALHNRHAPRQTRARFPDTIASGRRPGEPYSGTKCPRGRGAAQASFSRTSWLTADPSARPATWGMTSAITRPMSRMLVAPTSAIASSTIPSSSSSERGSGMNSS